jgi:hypothetical protein
MGLPSRGLERQERHGWVRIVKGGHRKAVNTSSTLQCKCRDVGGVPLKSTPLFLVQVFVMDNVVPLTKRKPRQMTVRKGVRYDYNPNSQ